MKTASAGLAGVGVCVVLMCSLASISRVLTVWSVRSVRLTVASAVFSCLRRFVFSASSWRIFACVFAGSRVWASWFSSVRESVANSSIRAFNAVLVGLVIAQLSGYVRERRALAFGVLLDVLDGSGDRNDTGKGEDPHPGGVEPPGR